MSMHRDRSGTPAALLAACVFFCWGGLLSLDAPARDNRTSRAYQTLWERQSMRDARQVVPAGQVRRPPRVVERQVVNQQILRSINNQIRQQTLSGVGRVQQVERRQQVRERVDKLMEQRKERMREKLQQYREEQLRQRQQQPEQPQDRSDTTSTTLRQSTTDPLTSFTDRRISAVSTDPAGETATTAPPPPQRAPTLTREQQVMMQEMQDTMEQMKDAMQSDMEADTQPTTDTRIIQTDTRTIQSDTRLTDTRDDTRLPTTDIRKEPSDSVEPTREPTPTITPAPTPTRPPTTDIRDTQNTSDRSGQIRRAKRRR